MNVKLINYPPPYCTQGGIFYSVPGGITEREGDLFKE